jgi:murein DD-endopeptidase MepM/ murein hydrolase activator NlpD
MKRVSSSYGGRTMGGRAENHSGLDMSATSGTAIYATGPGVVTKSGWGTGYGQYVEINHGNGYLTRYAHASRLIARVGDQVQAGEHIANVGCTGRCTGPHLHYEVVKDGERKNPSPYLAMLP